MYMQVFILLLLVIFAQGFPGNAAIEKETNKWGTEISFCTYKGIKFLPGSQWSTTDCEACSCFDDGLFCEGFGYAAGVFDAPEGCKTVNDGCQPRVVKKDDELKDCPLP
ncbi:beta-microseminoprotein-like [Haliotis rubra]|uniref:beta-microseminoprotein-like n=1 Tax=Haliotis rubra TaxID=36100 RepID=UPI001EE58231|nr:beta-microseminoprotein-like [Haliotis rubra]